MAEKKYRRILRIETEGHPPVDLEISQLTAMVGGRVGMELVEAKDGTWRMIYDESVFPDIGKLKNISLLRQEVPVPSVAPPPK